MRKNDLKTFVQSLKKHFTPMRSYYSFLLLLIPFSIFSQSPQQPTTSKQLDDRLYEVFEKSYLEKVNKDEPFLIQRWTFYLDNAFFISDNSLSKQGNDEDYPSVSIPNLEHLNILKLEAEQDLKHDFYTETIYKIKGTQKYLVYYSGKDFVEKLNAHIKTQK